MVWRMGDGTYTHRNTPVQVSGPERRHCHRGWRLSQPGPENQTGRSGRGDGTVVKVNGEVGTATSYTATYVKVSGISSVIAIAAGYNQGLAPEIRMGRVWAWGNNYHGELGNGTNTGAYPVQVSNLSNVTAIGS